MRHGPQLTTCEAKDGWWMSTRGGPSKYLVGESNSKAKHWNEHTTTQKVTCSQ